MDRRHWWMGIAVLVIAHLIHAAVPRYDWRAVADNPEVLIRVDRWTGRAEYGFLQKWYNSKFLQRQVYLPWSVPSVSRVGG